MSPHSSLSDPTRELISRSLYQCSIGQETREVLRVKSHSMERLVLSSIPNGRWVSPLDKWNSADGRLLLPCGLREMLLDIKLLSICLSSARQTDDWDIIELKQGNLDVTLVDTHEVLIKGHGHTITCDTYNFDDNYDWNYLVV
jgi:hypothetical protein